METPIALGRPWSPRDSPGLSPDDVVGNQENGFCRAHRRPSLQRKGRLRQQTSYCRPNCGSTLAAGRVRRGYRGDGGHPELRGEPCSETLPSPLSPLLSSLSSPLYSSPVSSRLVSSRLVSSTLLSSPPSSSSPLPTSCYQSGQEVPFKEADCRLGLTRPAALHPNGSDRPPPPTASVYGLTG